VSETDQVARTLRKVLRTLEVYHPSMGEDPLAAAVQQLQQAGFDASDLQAALQAPSRRQEVKELLIATTVRNLRTFLEENPAREVW